MNTMETWSPICAYGESFLRPARKAAARARTESPLDKPAGCATGSPAQFATTAEYFATRGLVAASGEYRIEDGKSAIRSLRMNARRMGMTAKRGSLWLRLETANADRGRLRNATALRGIAGSRA